MVLPVPARPGHYRARLRAQRVDCPSLDCGPETVFDLEVIADGLNTDRPYCETLLADANAALVDAQERQRLPDDYHDVTQGWFARAKRWLKRKLLGNFKTAYVDVLSRQQSQVNRGLVTAVQQLAECCATLDHALRGLEGRLGRLEDKTKATEQRASPNYAAPPQNDQPTVQAHPK